jgi:hypothetical protein
MAYLIKILPSAVSFTVLPVGLATITALKRNKESDKWFETKDLDFKLAA